MTRRTGLWAASLFLFAVLLVFHAMSPLVLDDYGFLARLGKTSDILAWVVHQYFTWDGRLTGYILNHTILSLPLRVANPLLALSQVGLIWVMAMHALGREWKTRVTGAHLLGIACLLWLSVPDLGQSFFWKTGSPYVTIPTLFLVLIWPYRALAEWGEYRARTLCLLIPLAVFCGLADFHETVAAAILITALSLWAMLKSGRRRILPFVPPALLLASFAVIYKAPGNMARLKALNPEFLNRAWFEGPLEHLANQGTIQAHFAWEYALAALSLFVLLRRAPGQERRPAVLPVMAGAFFLLGQAAQMVFMFAPSPENRVYTASTIFMILAALILFDQALTRMAGRKKTAFRAFWGAASAVCLVSLVTTGIMYAETSAYAHALETLARAAKPGSDLEVPPAPYLAGADLFYGRQCGIQKDADNWANEQFAACFKLGSIKLARPQFDLVSTGQAAGAFRGTVDGQELTFRYTPAGENAALPFYLAFPTAPETFWQKHGAPFLDRQSPGSLLFRCGLRWNYDHVHPQKTVGPGGFQDHAVLPFPDLATRGYIVHFRGNENAVASVVPLRVIAEKRLASRARGVAHRPKEDERP